MATLGGLYVNRHRSQYAPGCSTLTRREGCTWTSTANAADAATGGKVDRTPDQVHSLVPKSEETNPATPGWSLADAKKAMTKMGVPFEIRSGQGWQRVVDAWNEGRYVVLQGDSDRFPSGCSGDFDGDHAIGTHPAPRLVNGLRQRWINDPICPTGRWEFEYILRNYAIKFWATIMFAVTNPVPRVAPAAPKPGPSSTAVTLRYGGRRITRSVKRIAVPKGKVANVRSKPAGASKVVGTLANGKTFTTYQKADKFFGDRTGTRWLHVSSF